MRLRFRFRLNPITQLPYKPNKPNELNKLNEPDNPLEADDEKGFNNWNYGARWILSG